MPNVIDQANVTCENAEQRTCLKSDKKGKSFSPICNGVIYGDCFSSDSQST